MHLFLILSSDNYHIREFFVSYAFQLHYLLQIFCILESKIKFLTLSRSSPATQSIIYESAYKWTIQFYEENYSNFLYPKLFQTISNLKYITDQAERSRYLPTNTISMDVETVKLHKTLNNNQGTERNWKKFQLFETETQGDAVTIYCGGPIWAMAWAPTPCQYISDQILAISCLREHNINFPTDETFTSSEMIQFWNFGPLKNREKTWEEPKLEFCLAHDHGNVWCMEWCPSGCFNEYYENDVPENRSNHLARIGLLALACSDGSLPIYTISSEYLLKPAMNSFIKTEGPEEENSENVESRQSKENFLSSESGSNTPESLDDVKIFKTKPSFNLILSDNIDQNLGTWPYQCMKLSWTKYKNHEIVAAGYSNGAVALWNLMTESPLLRSEEDGVIILKPYHLFRAHDAPVTGKS